MREENKTNEYSDKVRPVAIWTTECEKQKAVKFDKQLRLIGYMS